MYRPGDYAYLADLPAPLLCRVHEVEAMPLTQGRCQRLHLVPLAGPWPAGTILIRLEHCMHPIDAGDRRRGRSVERMDRRTGGR
jgi:hypothetical protein